MKLAVLALTRQGIQITSSNSVWPMSLEARVARVQAVHEALLAFRTPVAISQAMGTFKMLHIKVAQVVSKGEVIKVVAPIAAAGVAVIRIPLDLVIINDEKYTLG